MAVPFFLLAGEIMNAGGLSRRIVNLALVMVGHVRGGLGFVAIFAACVIASLSGSAVADAAALGALLFPMMRNAGHEPGRAAGLIASASIIAFIRPPSVSSCLAWLAAFQSPNCSWRGIFTGLMFCCAVRDLVHPRAANSSNCRKANPVHGCGFPRQYLGLDAAGHHHCRPSLVCSRRRKRAWLPLSIRCSSQP